MSLSRLAGGGPCSWMELTGTSYMHWSKSAHRSLRPAGRLTRMPPTSCTPWMRTSDRTEERRLCRRTRGLRSYKLHRGGSGGGLETSRGGAGVGSPQPESWTGSAAASARTLRAGVYALLDWHNLPVHATRLLRLE